MAHEYTVGGGAIAVAAGVNTLVALMPGAAATTPQIELRRAWMAQAVNATSAQTRVQLTSKAAALQSAMTAKTPERLKRYESVSILLGAAAPAATGTASIGNATVTEGAGAQTAIIDDSFNNLNGWLWVPTPDEVIIFPAGGAVAACLFLPVAPSVTTWSFGLCYAER